MIRMHAGRDPTETSNEPIEILAWRFKTCPPSGWSVWTWLGSLQSRIGMVSPPSLEIGTPGLGITGVFLSSQCPVSAEQSSPCAKPSFSESQSR
ncbi:uncharacterized protein PgNI_02049 [Pyricularia grisea]|uniref:Uncharacterized protein n=1 Tax=Pyricularia grisea TaxID=148305 RepID=A0A6P8BG22_PYRGI|nr:uncharacterized protein PgNI_02049 [Pyricularia grisea]TLD15665.1 hypothetical protein PgNI_02049 [Pyricularia grisea]